MIELVANIAGLVGMIVGLVLILISLAHRTKEEPMVGSMNPRHWKPLWEMQSWFTPRGFKLHIIAWGLFLCGNTIMIVQNLIL